MNIILYPRSTPENFTKRLESYTLRGPVTTGNGCFITLALAKHDREGSFVIDVFLHAPDEDHGVLENNRLAGLWVIGIPLNSGRLKVTILPLEDLTADEKDPLLECASIEAAKVLVERICQDFPEAREGLQWPQDAEAIWRFIGQGEPLIRYINHKPENFVTWLNQRTANVHRCLFPIHPKDTKLLQRFEAIHRRDDVVNLALPISPNPSREPYTLVMDANANIDRYIRQEDRRYWRRSEEVRGRRYLSLSCRGQPQD